MSDADFGIPKTRDEFIDRLMVDDELFTAFRAYIQCAWGGNLEKWWELREKYPWTNYQDQYSFMQLAVMEGFLNRKWKPGKHTLSQLWDGIESSLDD